MKQLSNIDNLIVLYEDNHIIAVNKRVGDIVQGDKTGDNPLSEIVKSFLKKKYKTSRIIISWVYNIILRFLFKINFKDISTGSRLIKKSLVNKIKLTSNSPFVGAELAVKTKYRGYKVNEIGIHTYPRTFGTGSSVSLKNIALTIKDMIKLYFKVKPLNFLLEKNITLI